MYMEGVARFTVKIPNNNKNIPESLRVMKSQNESLVASKIVIVGTISCQDHHYLPFIAQSTMEVRTMRKLVHAD